MGVDWEEDIKRRPIELNIRAARKRQSAQTGFVHYCYEADVERHDTIPVFENFCFALALVRSKQSENVLEGLALLQKLLAFEGGEGFPVYLHEFPLCRDRLLGLRLLPLFYTLLTDFGAIIGNALRQSLQQVVKRIVSLGYEALASKALPLRYEWLLKAYAEPLQMPEFIPLSVEQMGYALTALPMAHKQGASVAAFFERLSQKWHPHLLTYLGVQEQEKTEPKPSLFDLFMSDHYQKYPERLLLDHPIHLRAALVEKIPGVILPEIAEGAGGPYQEIAAHPVQPYVLYWGSPKCLHSLVCDPKKAECRISALTQGAQYTFELKNPGFQEDPMEIAFFCDLRSTERVLVSGQRSTTFQLEESVEVPSPFLRLRIVFSLVEGTGNFFGHIARGNRPMQSATRGAMRYEAYDWRIGIRTIRRSERCVLRAILQWM